MDSDEKQIKDNIDRDGDVKDEGEKRVKTDFKSSKSDKCDNIDGAGTCDEKSGQLSTNVIYSLIFNHLLSNKVNNAQKECACII